MLTLKLTKEKMLNHFRYEKWKYIGAVVAVIAIWSFLYPSVIDRIPDNERLLVCVAAKSVRQDRFLQTENEAQVAMPEIRKIEFQHILYSGVSDVTGTQVLGTLLQANRGDIYIIDRTVFESRAAGGSFMSLDDAMQTGELLLPNQTKRQIALQDGRMKRDRETQEHQFGIPLKAFKGFIHWDMSVEDKYIVIMESSKNKVGALKLFNWLMQKFWDEP